MSDPHQPLFPSSGNAANTNPGPVGYPQIAGAGGYPQMGAGPLPQGAAGGSRPPTAGQIPKSWIIIGAVILAVIVVIAAVAAFVGSSGSKDSAGIRQEDSIGQSDSLDPSDVTDSPRRTSSVASPPTQAVPPPLVQESDTFGEMCGNGFHVSGRSGWATNAGRGSPQTSCSFAHSVLLAYWDQYGSPNVERRTVIAAGRVPCPSTGGRCAGDDFVMECAALGSEPWITCTGGRNARVYLY